MALVTKPVRGLDEEVYRQAKAAAAREGKPIGTWINEAMAEKLHASDLYEACKEALPYVMFAKKQLGKTGADKAVIKLKRAIAKAEGKK